MGMIGNKLQHLEKTAIAMGAAHIALLASGAVWAQTTPGQTITTVVVVGQRAALDNAQKIKQNSDEIVDSIVADDLGKLPDKSVTEALQRVPGVTMDRTLNRVDPQQGVGDGVMHFAAEGTGVAIRGLSHVRSEFNGRDGFSANGGRALSFEDVPPELMAGMDVYKNPSAEQIEGGIGGLVNLRTALPFDSKGRKLALSSEIQASSLRKTSSPPSLSVLYSDRWSSSLGQFGALVSLAHSKVKSRSDSIFISPYISRDDLLEGDQRIRWITPGAALGSTTFDRTREGMYGALQWKNGPLASNLTYLRSKYKMDSAEHMFFTGGGDPAKLQLDPGAVFDDMGALQAGTLRDPTNGGVGFQPGLGLATVARVSGRTSDTRDLSWSLSWRPNERWTVKTELQRVRASTAGADNLTSLGGWVPGQTLDLRASPPVISYDQQARDFLADPAHYYWGSTQIHYDVAKATMNAARLDAKYTFDSPVLRDLRFGIRATERESLTQSTRDSEWSSITSTWHIGPEPWQSAARFATLDDPRFSGDAHLHTFNNFFGGASPAPVFMPDIGPTGSPAHMAKLHSYHEILCKEANAQFGRSNNCSWSPPPFGDKQGRNEQRERTQAAYAQLRFGFDRLKYPIDGNMGVRVVRTNPESTGAIHFDPPPKPLIPGVPDIPASSEQQTFENRYTKVLPSLNLRMKAGEQWQFRLGLSRAMSRPDFYQLQAYGTLRMDIRSHTPPPVDGVVQPLVLDSVSYNGELRGNTKLMPVMANNIDVTAEYYAGAGKSVTLGLFTKRLKGLVIGQTDIYQLRDVQGSSHDFMVRGPVNGMDARVSGAELGFRTYFDKLPGAWSGLGMSGNFTYIDSSTRYRHPVAGAWCTPKDSPAANILRDQQGCDTDGRVFGNMPLQGMSKTAYNLALLYDKGPLSMRLAYSWRDKYLQSTNTYGTAGGEGIDRNPDSPTRGSSYSVNYGLPTWGGAYGQLDLGFQYQLTDKLRLDAQVGNLSNQVYKQYMQQGIGMKLRGAFRTGRSFSAQLNYAF